MVDVSVIIPTWNNSRRLGITLGAIAACRVPADLRWEVIVVANACTDDTAEVVADCVEGPPMVLVEEPRPGVCRARNAGVARARGQLLLFADDDVRPCPDWLGVYWAGYAEHGDRHYLFGRLWSEFEGDPPDPALLRVAHFAVRGLDYGSNSRQYGPEAHFAEANWACPASALRTAGGFNPDLGLDSSSGRRRCGEAFDLGVRLHALGVCGFYLPDAAVHHFVPRSKSTLRHLGEAQRARGAAYAGGVRPPYYLERLPRLSGRLGNDGPSVLEALRVLTLISRLWPRWLVARLAGRNGYEEYATLQFCLGMIRRYLEMLRLGLVNGRLGS
jgi:hypothetical protein